MQPHRRRKWLLIAGVLLGLAPIVWHCFLRVELAVYRKSLRDRGERLEIVDLIPVESGTNNGAASFNAATLPLMRTPHDYWITQMLRVSPGRARVTWKEFSNLEKHHVSRPGLTRIFGELVTSNETALAAVIKSLECESIRFPITYDPTLVTFGHLMLARDAARELSFGQLWYLASGRYDEAWKCLRAVTRLAHVQRNERLIISTLIRYGIIAYAISGTWEALHYDGWSDDQWRELQALWQGMDFLADAESAIAMERAFVRQYVEIERQGQNVIFGAVIPGTSGFLDHVRRMVLLPREGIPEFIEHYPKYAAWRWFHSYSDERDLLVVWQETLESVRRVQKQRDWGLELSRMEAVMAKSAEDEDWVANFLGVPKRSDWQLIRKLANADIEIEMTITAIALKRFQMKYGRPAGTLGELVPEYLVSPPIDRMNGAPLSYCLRADGTFDLYSVGIDRVDTGGRDDGPAEQIMGSFGVGPDKVWPTAASSKGVLEFYEQERPKLRSQ